MTCKTCRFLDVPLTKNGHRPVSPQRVYTCLAPDPVRPHVPASCEIWDESFKWPPPRCRMTGMAGKDCPCHEDFVPTSHVAFEVTQ